MKPQLASNTKKSSWFVLCCSREDEGIDDNSNIKSYHSYSYTNCPTNYIEKMNEKIAEEKPKLISSFKSTLSQNEKSSVNYNMKSCWEDEKLEFNELFLYSKNSSNMPIMLKKYFFRMPTNKVENVTKTYCNLPCTPKLCTHDPQSIRSLDKNIFSDSDEGHVFQVDFDMRNQISLEALAYHLAKKFNNENLIIFDAFAGVGGNSIQFAKKGNFVIANEIEEKRCQYLRNNAELYNQSKRIEIIAADFLELDFSQSILYRMLKPDIVFLNPSWNIPKEKNQNFDMNSDITPNIHMSLDQAYKISSNIILAIPRFCHLDQIITVFIDFIKRNKMFIFLLSQKIKKLQFTY